ncbi:hypothetical protein BGX27_005271 [Mortierella sp. AM989]|nr:hypothetical protein BGX27_005271 [Mortierella sp. AM989]
MGKSDPSSGKFARRGHEAYDIKKEVESHKEHTDSDSKQPQHSQGQHLVVSRQDQKVLAQLPLDIDSLDIESLSTLARTQLPTGLKLPDNLDLKQLQNIINEFHKNETRTDVLTELPQDFEPAKSVFSFLYAMNTFKDPSLDLPGCAVATTPLSPSDTPSGMVWECESGHFCVAPNMTVPCLPGFYCPANTAQPTLCCQGYLCSPDTKTIEVCPEGYFCPMASVRPLPCNFLAYCPRGTSTAEKYGLGAILFAFVLCVMSVFAIKTKVFRAQRDRYRRRLRELGDNSEDSASMKRRMKEAAELAQSIILEDQRKIISGSQARGGEGGLDFAASQRNLALAAVAAGNMNVSTMTLPKAERSFDIRFEKLGLTLPTGVDIIQNISGRLITGRTCAVMGPSGAGKTTFLSILAGKVAKTEGSIKVNGKEQTLSLWKKLIGFVPQEDVMLSELTVREILMHSARMRQPVHMSHNEKRLKVLEVIQFLGIGHIMDNPIGDVETRGVSGGERKRVNIGMELVASPSILFLDEPTSGLDSATSFEVCKLLRQIAQEQFLTVAAVVHSPSPHAFNQFDDLLLLGAGGRVVYSGPRDEAAEYFESIGYPVPENENPADFFISLAAGRVNRSQLQTEYDSHVDYAERLPFERMDSIKNQSPRERTKELFIHWDQHCRNRTMAKTLEKRAIHESETMTTVLLSNDGSVACSPEKCESLRAERAYPDGKDDLDAVEKSFAVNVPTERNYHVSTMALHQPSRPQSPTCSVPISNLAGSSADTSEGSESSKESRYGILTSIRIYIKSTLADTAYYLEDVASELFHWLWSIKCKFTGEKDPVRETPSFFSVFYLCFRRSCLQNYGSQMEFLYDQALHLSCGLCVSFASKDMLYIPRQPAEICALAPPSIQLSCATPIDDIRYVGMFMALGVFFAGINVGACTFGDEKGKFSSVFWRDTSAGMPTLPYYFAKVLADFPRMIVASCMYTGAFIFFFAYQEKLSTLLLLVFLLYINAFSMGYFVSTVVNRSMFGLAGTGMSLTWALVLSGTAPRLYQVMTSSGYSYVRWIWDISAPRWAVEAFYLKEMESRTYNEIKHNLLGDMYSFDDYQRAILCMVYIALAWNVVTFTLMKLVHRHKVK